MFTAKVLLNEVGHVKNFVEIVSKFEEDIDLIFGRYITDAKSILGIFSFDLSKPVEIHIHAEEDKAKEILDALKEYLA